MAKFGHDDSFAIHNLAARYRSGQLRPTEVAEECLRRIDAHGDPAVWIDRFSPQEVMAQALGAEQKIRAGEWSPLLGVPFAIKDNIDAQGHATTAACPDFAYWPIQGAAAVRRLCELGAVLVGKTNLDQFATGLVGTRSPYGTPRNPFDEAYIPGGSSSGSAVAVAAGLVGFALGTDTAGSGRVPAAFNNIIGLKPTRGRISAAGVVPACQSLDCVSIFSLTCQDAAAVMDAIADFDANDIYSRPPQAIPPPLELPAAFRFGIPADNRLKFFADPDAEALYRQSVDRMAALGGSPVVIDFAPFLNAGELLYDGPWVAERLSGLREFVANNGDSILPITRGILHSARRFDGIAAFDGLHDLQNLRRRTELEWAKMDVLLLPTAGTIYSRAEIEADPVRRNMNLGYYTTFMNLLDLCGVAVPAGFTGNGLPFGVTVIGQAGQDAAVLGLGARLHRAAGIGAGKPGYSLDDCSTGQPAKSSGDSSAPTKQNTMKPMTVQLAVVGAHLTGQPLNGQLTSLSAALVRTCRTATNYRLFALKGTIPPKPGLERTDAGGGPIEVEVWEMTVEAFGAFVAAIPPPMAIGTIRLEDGQEVKGFLCEKCATSGADDITRFGGWRNYLRNGI